MKPGWRRLEPTAAELYEVRWTVPTHQRGDVMVRRFRRERDAVAFAERLRDRKAIRDIRVWRAPIGRWREVALPERDWIDEDSSSGTWGW